MTEADPPAAPYRPDPAFADLGGPPFADPVEPAAFPQTILRYRNDRWAAAVGLGDLSEADWIARLARFEPLDRNLPQPLALRYHGHQFRVYNPEIGDGRGFLYAQLRDGAGRLLDLGTKGSGLTPWSRTADGRLTLKGAVREILATEMLEALGVYTSKTFSVVETGESLWRGDEPSPTRSAVLVRLGHSHIRFGAFQRLAFERDDDGLRRLIDYCVTAFDPDLEALPAADRTPAFFARVVARTARLAAQWMAAGFVHGVLNSDNMNVTGESFDYGPWRFLPETDFGFTAAYFDHSGLYAYGRQPDAALWNLAQFGGALSRIAAQGRLDAALQTFAPAFERAMSEAFHARLGLVVPAEGGFPPVVAFLRAMAATGAPFERVMFDRYGGPASAERAAASPLAPLYRDEDFAPAEAFLAAAEPADPGRLEDSYFAGEGPCLMRIEEVEALWAAIAERDDWTPLAGALSRIGAMRAAYGLDASAWRPDPWPDLRPDLSPQETG